MKTKDISQASKPVTLCIPTLNCYDLLKVCVDSSLHGSVRPTRIIIVDNGGALNEFTSPEYTNVEIYRPRMNIGVACSWNYLIRNSTEHRIIVNDDIEFHHDTIEKIVEALETGNEFVGAIRKMAFACFGISDSLIQKIGMFDERISPNYAYFEDNDYAYRMKLAGVHIFEAEAEATHLGSSTIKHYTKKQLSAHHKKFRLARSNYIKKWGGLPGSETLCNPKDLSVDKSPLIDAITFSFWMKLLVRTKFPFINKNMKPN